MSTPLASVFSTLRLWLVTAFRAAAGLTALMSACVLMTSVLTPLQAYAITLGVDALIRR